MQKIINLYAGPGAGKSTTAAHLFALMKMEGVVCELVTEAFKEPSWVSPEPLSFEQKLVLGAEQIRRCEVLKDKVDYIITDSPILLLAVYSSRSIKTCMRDLAYIVYSSYENIDVLIKRTKPYVRKGRRSSEEQAKQLDRMIHRLVNHPRATIDGDEHAAFKIKDMILNQKQDKRKRL